MTHGDDIQLVTFRCGGHDFAFDILQLQRILRYEVPSPLPDAPDFLEGVLSYEGSAVPVVDLRKRLGLPATVTEETRVMLLELDGHRVGVVVDAAREVVRVDSTTISAPPPMVRGLAARYISGILARPERTIVILNAQRLLADDERNVLHHLEITT
jgi:purine-binding chemotaxis protein CheW